MVRTLFLPVTALMVMLLGGCVQQTVRSQWPDGGTRHEGQLTGGSQTGTWRYYHPDGQLAAQGGFVSDEQDGAWEGWHPDGSPHYRGSYRAGLRHGLWWYHHPGGAVLSVGSFAADRPTGPWQFNHPDGTVHERGTWVRGRKHGLWTVYDEQGRMVEAACWFDGKRVGPGFDFEAGAVKREDAPLPPGLAAAGQAGDGFLIRRFSWEGGALWVRFTDGGQPQTAVVTTRPIDGRELDFRTRQGLPGGDETTPPLIWQHFTSDGAWLAGIDDQRALMVAAADGRMASATSWLGSDNSPQTPDPQLPSPRAAAISGSEAANALLAMQPSAVDSATTEQPAELALPSTEAPIHHAPAFWTKSEEGKLGDISKLYTDGTVAKGSSYDDRGPSKRTSFPDRRPDLANTRLPIRRFLTESGRVVDLDRSDRNTLLVILRGFAGQVCIYCSEQTRILAEMESDFNAAGYDLVFLYPGPSQSVPMFLNAIDSLGGIQGDQPTICLDLDLALVRALDIEAELAKPTVMLLDGDDRITYTYVGRDMADRPSAEALLELARNGAD